MGSATGRAAYWLRHGGSLGVAAMLSFVPLLDVSARQQKCTLVTDVEVQLVDYDGPFDRPIRLDLPDGTSLPSRPKDFAWRTTLGRPTQIDSVLLKPVLDWYAAVGPPVRRTSGPPGECVGHLAFRVERLWRVEVSADGDLPVLVTGKVQGMRGVDTTFSNTTAFPTPKLRESETLAFEIYAWRDNPYAFTLDMHRFGSSKEVVHPEKQIQELTCKSTGRCNRRLKDLLRQQPVRTIRFRLINKP